MKHTSSHNQLPSVTATSVHNINSHYMSISKKVNVSIVSSALSQLCDLRVSAHLCSHDPGPAVSCRHSSVTWMLGHTSPTFWRYLPACRPVSNYTTWWQADVCEQLAQSSSRPFDHLSDAVTITPSSHMSILLLANYHKMSTDGHGVTEYMLVMRINSQPNQALNNQWCFCRRQDACTDIYNQMLSALLLCHCTLCKDARYSMPKWEFR